MSKNVLNEGYQSSNKILFDKGFKDFIYSKNRKFIDIGFCSGANLLGHNSEIHNKTIKKILQNKISNFSSPNKYAEELGNTILKLMPKFSKIIFCNSGSEANIKALRICRAITNKSKVACATGSWHGSVDQFLFKSSKKLKNIKLSDGITNEEKKNLLFIPYNNIDGTKKILDKNKQKLSCIFIEPIQGCLPSAQAKKYLKFLENYSKKNNILLVFDEMITGVRTNLTSAQQHFKITTPISTFGKAFANGMPIGFIAISPGVEKIIKKRKLSVYFGGTFSGNSLVAYYANEYLKYLINNKKRIFSHLEKVSNLFQKEINNFSLKNNINVKIYRFCSMTRLVYSSKYIDNRSTRDFLEKIKSREILNFKKFVLKKNIYYPNNGIIFFSYASNIKNLKKITSVFKKGLKKYFK